MRWSHLPHAPFRLLAYMALTAKDDDETPMFYQGQEGMAMALGMDPDANAKARQSAFRALRYHVSTLETSGAIKRVFAGAPGRNAEYELSLSMQRRKASIPQTEEVELPPSDTQRRKIPHTNGGSSTAQRRKKNYTTAEGHLPPEDIQDYRTKEQERSTHSGRSTSRARGRGRARDETTDSLFDEAQCAECRTDHTGLTCAQYRNGDDLRKASHG